MCQKNIGPIDTHITDYERMIDNLQVIFWEIFDVLKVENGALILGCDFNLAG